MSKLHISSTPHIHQKGSSTRNIMLDVVIAMLPATIAGIVIFGISALWTVLTCVISAVVAEYVFNLCVGKKQTIGDLSAVVTGLLLALNVSTAVPLWQCAVGSVFAIVVVKCLFGGIGKNIVNPAITARVFMLLTFGAVGAVALPTVVEITTGATPLAALNQGAEVGAAEAPSLMDLFLGLHGGAIGETCAVATFPFPSWQPPSFATSCSAALTHTLHFSTFWQAVCCWALSSWQPTTLPPPTPAPAAWYSASVQVSSPLRSDSSVCSPRAFPSLSSP